MSADLGLRTHVQQLAARLEGVVFTDTRADLDYQWIWTLVEKGLASVDDSAADVAVKCLGHLALVDSAAGDHLELHHRRALGWLHPLPGTRSRHLHVACQIIAEIAENTPTLIYLHVQQVISSCPAHHPRNPPKSRTLYPTRLRALRVAQSIFLQHTVRTFSTVRTVTTKTGRSVHPTQQCLSLTTPLPDNTTS